MDATRRPACLPRLALDRLAGWTARPRQRRLLAAACQLVPAILPQIPPPPGMPPPAGWRIQRAQWTQTGVAVIALGAAERTPGAILKLPYTSEGVASLRRQRQVQTTLHAEGGLGAWRDLLPRPLAAGNVAGRFYVVEQALPGQPALPSLADPAARARLQAAAAAAIGRLHRGTSAQLVVDAATLERWVDRPLRLIRQATRRRPAVERLAAELHAALAGRIVRTSWIHGDFWPGNLLVDPETLAVTGIVDWDLAEPDHLPALDLFHLLWYSRWLAQRRGLDEVLRALATGSAWMPEERAILEAGQAADSMAALPERALLRLSWLRHIAANLGQSAAYARDRQWVARNIDGVLCCV